MKVALHPDRHRRGVTLAEMMVAVAVGGIVVLVVGALSLYSLRSFAAMANYVDLDHRSRMALDKMTQQIRQANRLVSFTTTALTFEDYDGGVLSFVYNPDDRTLYRSKDGVSDPDPLLTECDQLQFSIFQRNTIGGTYDQFPTGSPSTCKLVQLHWVCSREILGAKVNTESVQSAKIVIRKQ